MINRYKMKPGWDFEKIKSFVSDKLKQTVINGGKWISEDSCHFFSHWLVGEIELYVGLPEDLSTWDDYKHILVLDEDFGQPYTPFYGLLENPKEKSFKFLRQVVSKYNKFMDSLEFLEEHDG